MSHNCFVSGVTPAVILPLRLWSVPITPAVCAMWITFYSHHEWETIALLCLRKRIEREDELGSRMKQHICRVLLSLREYIYRSGNVELLCLWMAFLSLHACSLKWHHRMTHNAMHAIRVYGPSYLRHFMPQVGKSRRERPVVPELTLSNGSSMAA